MDPASACDVGREEIEMLKKVAVPLLGIAAIVTVAGCGGKSSSPPTASAPAGTPPSASVAAPANVNGTWTGALVGGAPVSMQLKQAGPNVTGDLRVGGRADISGPIEGTVEGNTIKLRERSGFGTAPLLSVRGDQITGIVGGTTLDLRRAK